eukprot:337077_1
MDGVILRVDDFRNNLNENGTVEFQCKLKKIGDSNILNNSNSLSLDICHDFSKLETSINSLKFIHRDYFVTILNTKHIQTLPNKTTFLMNAIILNKDTLKYIPNLIHKILFDIKLNRTIIQSQYKYCFILRFIKIPSFLDLNKNKIFNIPINGLNNQHVVKFVFKSIVMQKYNIVFPYDIMSLLFDGFIFNCIENEDVTKYYGTMTLNEKNHRHHHHHHHHPTPPHQIIKIKKSF